MKVLGEEIDFAENLRFSLAHYGPWWLLLLATMAFDFLTTLGFVAVFGIDREANLVAHWLMGRLGVETGVFVAKLLQLFSVTAFVSLNRRLGNVVLILVTLLNGWAVVINTL